MRTGAAGRIAIASRPMCRMSCRRRFANSSRRMGPRRRKRVVGELGPRAHELEQLEEVALARFVIAGRLELDARDIGQVPEVLADFARPRDLVACCSGADAVEEPAAPG